MVAGIIIGTTETLPTHNLFDRIGQSEIVIVINGMLPIIIKCATKKK
jgi:hypothetical protein